jgi:tRNA pseudouridine38-40 synthase
VRTLKITLAYDGTEFVGWQRQSDGVSVQAALEDALARIHGAPVSVAGAGRTDAGVHAAGQVASVALDTPHDTATLRRALNAMLPDAVRVLGVEDAAPDFHARFGAVSKTYHYRIANGPVASPFLRRWSWHVPWTLDVEAMRDAARRLEGEHDFAAFQSSGTDVRTSVRRIDVSRLVDAAGARGAALGPGDCPQVEIDGRLLVYQVEGTGFLRHMVRAIAGTLVEVGSGRATPEGVTELLDRRDRALAGPTAPASGLCLARVTYAPGAVAAQR